MAGPKLLVADAQMDELNPRKRDIDDAKQPSEYVEPPAKMPWNEGAPVKSSLQVAAATGSIKTTTNPPSTETETDQAVEGTELVEFGVQDQGDVMDDAWRESDDLFGDY